LASRSDEDLTPLVLADRTNGRAYATVLTLDKMFVNICLAFSSLPYNYKTELGLLLMYTYGYSIFTPEGCNTHKR